MTLETHMPVETPMFYEPEPWWRHICQWKLHILKASRN